MKKYIKYNKYKKMLTYVYDRHKNKNKNNDKRVIGIAQLCLSAVLKILPTHPHCYTVYKIFGWSARCEAKM